MEVDQLINEDVFCDVFNDQKEVIVSMINDLCNENYDINKDRVQIVVRKVENKKNKIKKYQCDFNVIINNYNLYNFEINNRYIKNLDSRNNMYFFKILSFLLDKFEDKEKSKVKATQINIDNFHNFIAFKNSPVDEFEMRSIYTNKGKNISIIHIDVNMLKEMYIKDKNDKKNRWGAIFLSDTIEEISDILGSDMLDIDVKNKFIYKLNSVELEKLADFDIPVDYDQVYEDELNDKYKEGISQGSREKTDIIIKEMLKENTDINFISKVTKESTEYIMNIKNNM